MIICFSGEGNTLAVSNMLASHLDGERLIQPSAEMLRNPLSNAISIGDDLRVIWTFPVYSWGIPPVMARLMRRINIKSSDPSRVVHHMVCTCGDDAGMVDRRWRKIMKYRGFNHAGAFSVIMPNTYVCMKGFDTDPQTTVEAKLKAAPKAVDSIAALISSGFNGSRITRGAWPRFKSYIIYPWFVRHCMSPEGFSTDSSCRGCGYCISKCPLANISLSNGKAVWGDQCAFCLRCYHLCPSHSITYRNKTLGKGQYRNGI